MITREMLKLGVMRVRCELPEADAEHLRWWCAEMCRERWPDKRQWQNPFQAVKLGGGIFRVPVTFPENRFDDVMAYVAKCNGDPVPPKRIIL